VGLEINAKKKTFVMVSRKPYNENQCVKLGNTILKQWKTIYILVQF